MLNPYYQEQFNTIHFSSVWKSEDLLNFTISQIYTLSHSEDQDNTLFSPSHYFIIKFTTEELSL